jgi:hypothetical protein
MKWRSNEVKKKEELTQRTLSSDTEGTEIYAREKRDQAELERRAAGLRGLRSAPQELAPSLTAWWFLQFKAAARLPHSK